MPEKCCFEIYDCDPEKVKKLSDELDISEVIARLLVNRGIDNQAAAKQFLSGELQDMTDPFMMKGIPEAVELIQKHIDLKNKILIHGDYDADGVTSTAIMIKALERIGATTEYYIPVRFEEGYGFSEDAVGKAIESEVKLIITVDCGSSSHDSINKARAAGIDVIITDHHEVPDIPKANVFVNPKRHDETFPYTSLSGAGVALKLIEAIYRKLERDDWVDFLDISAVGTVADVVPLTGENRIIVKEGIKLLNKRKHPGIAKLLELSNIKRDTLSPWDISFIIAPKINAAGRLADATVALEFLLEEDPEKALQLAVALSDMNEERQRIENGINEEINRIINEDPDLLSTPVWVFGSRGWHQGVIGIVASRFSQSFKRPVFLISIDENGTGRGSARCSEGYSIYDALCSAKDVLELYGGHQLAGGFSIKEENIDKFKERVNSLDLFSEAFKQIKVDMELEHSKINLDLAKELEALSPFGEGNPKPIFLAKRVKIESHASVGNLDQHLKIWISNGVADVKGIAFGKGSIAGQIWNEDFYYDILFNLDVDYWNNIEAASVKVQEIIMPDSECVRIITGLDEIGIKQFSENTDKWKLVDARHVINRHKYLKMLYRSRKRSLILTRNKKQMEVLMENLLHEGVECESLLSFPNGITDDAKEGLFIAPYDRINCSGAFCDVVLYHPPYLREHFHSTIFSCNKLERVHLLFGDKDIYREELNQEILSPDRDKLLKIYMYLKKLASEADLTPINPENISSLIKDELIHGVTVRLAIKIFSEIGLLEYTEEDGKTSIKMLKSERQDLENSSTFMAQMKKKESFTQLKDMYIKPFLYEFEEAVFEKTTI